MLLFFKNYLSNRSQQVIIIDVFLVMLKLRRVCHKGTSWAFTFFLLHVAFRRYAERFKNKLPFLADDTVFYFEFGLTLSQCLFDNILTSIQRWFSNAKLKLNADKSEHMNFRKCKIVKHGLLRLPEHGNYTEQVKFPSYYIDCQFTLQRQFNFVCSTSFHYLRKVGSIRYQVKTLVSIELIRVLVLSRVDYRNSLYYSLPNFLLAKLQGILNSARV